MLVLGFLPRYLICRVSFYENQPNCPVSYHLRTSPRTDKKIVEEFTYSTLEQTLQYLHLQTDLRAFFIFTCCLQLFKTVPANMRSKEPTKALLLSVCCFVKVDHLLKKRRFFPWNKIENHDFICSDNYHHDYSLSSTIPKVNLRGIMPFYYMATLVRAL